MFWSIPVFRGVPVFLVLVHAPCEGLTQVTLIVHCTIKVHYYYNYYSKDNLKRIVAFWKVL